MAIKLSFELSGPLSAEGVISAQIIDYSVTEDATPLAAGDSSGSVGTFTVTIPRATGAFVTSSRSFRSVLDRVGPTIFEGSEVRLTDSRKGYTLGNVTGVEESRDGATITLSGISRLGKLSVFGIQAQPFAGTLRNAFLYYASLADIVLDVFVDDDIASRYVVFQGWHGELWYSLKQLAAAQDCDISLVSGVILLRPIRKRVATQNRETSRAISTGTGTLAQAIEIYQYNNREIVNEPIYPPGGWTPEVEVLNVNAGETTEYTLELSASVTYFYPPEMRTFVEAGYDPGGSVYTIVGDDGVPVLPAQWSAFGGSLEIEVLPDTRSLLVTLKGAVGVPTASGTASSTFSVALGSDVTGSRYSTLRINGTGVAFNKEKVVIRTGVPASRTATEVGVTIDNAFISTREELYQAGTRAARSFAGSVMSLSSNVISINKRGDTGQAQYPTYGSVRAEVISRIGPGATYADERALHGTQDYAMVRDYWFGFFRDDDVDQVFGNAQGARVFDKKSRRWYRIRSANPSPVGISFQADDDLLYGDIVSFYPAGNTYADMVARRQGLTYLQSEMAGLLE